MRTGSHKESRQIMTVKIWYNSYDSNDYAIYPLTAMLWTLILQCVFSNLTDSLLIVFLQYSKELSASGIEAFDARLLIPTLTDFFKKHPLINPKIFLGDAAFGFG
jgi:hypothetical protein